MFNMIPGVGWVIDLLLKMSMALPFWLTWTVGGIGEKFFYFLPSVFHVISFWECVGLFIAVPIAKIIFLPSIISNSNTCGMKSKKENKENKE